MKKIFRNLKFGLLLCAGAFAASCSDVEDAMDEIPYTRVLQPQNFEAEVIANIGTDITFKWSPVSNADAYLLELLEATLAEDGETFKTPDSADWDDPEKTKLLEVAKDDVPYTAKNLEVDKTFWARIRGVSNQIESSHWSYLAEPISTSAVRQTLNPEVKERTSTSVTLIWDNADDKLDLTSIRYEPVTPVEGVTAQVVTLTQTQKEDCMATIEELDPCTNYKFTLLFGRSGSRGNITTWTRPNTEGAQMVNNLSELTAALQNASGDLKLKLAYNDGQVYDLTTIMTMHATEPIFNPYEFAHNLEIYGESTPDGVKPVVKGAFKMVSGATKIHFEDIAIDGGKICGYFVTLGTQISEAEFVNCEMTGFVKGIWSSDTFIVENLLSFDGLYVYDVNATGSGAGDFIDIRSGEGINNYGTVEIKNSTFYACGRTFLRIREKSGFDKICLSNCTFNQVATGSSPNIFDIRNYTPSLFTMTKCVFLNEANSDESSRLTRNSADNFAPVCNGNLYYNVATKWLSESAKCQQTDGTTFSQALALAEGGQILADDPCTNSIAGKMYLKNNSIIAANKVGDPRWWNASAPVIVRPTELETVTETTTWNFTDKTKFDTETIESNQIIENIRIYAPAEVVMSEGITFGAAATVSTKGVPLTSALAFNAEGYGSIEVTAQGTGITSTVQIIAGGDAYSINADGKPHKVVLGDLVGANDIYVLPSVPNITFTKIAWTKDTTPEVVTQQLAKPELTIDATSIEQGTSTAITATWEHNAHAATYAVTFNGTTTEVTDSEFVIAAETVAALAIGEYTISVIAKPTATSTKYLQSEAGEAKFRIKDPNASVKEPLLWDCNASSFDAIANKLGTDGSVTATIPDLIWDGLTILNGGKTKYGTATINGETMRFLQWGGKGAANKDRSCYFKASAPGKLYVVASNTGSSEDTARLVAVTVNGVEQTQMGGVASSTTTTCEFTIDISEETTIYVYPSGNGLRFFSIKYVFD